MDFFIEASEVKFRYEEMLQKAAQERLARRVAGYQPTFETRLLRGLGETLITLGQSLKSMALSL
jgi:hypothetical protein